MSIPTIPSRNLSLHGIPHENIDPKTTTTPAILFKLSHELLQDVQKASGGKDGLQFVTGAAPKLRLGKRTIDLTISSEAFRHELFRASTENLGSLDFAGVIGHCAELKAPERTQSLGSDAALAALQNSLASYHQEKAAKSVNYTGSVIAAPKNRFEANREQKHARRRGLSGSHQSSPSISASATPHLGAAPTSAPSCDFEIKLRAMRKPLIHLLAIKPLTRDDIVETTKIPKDDLEEVLQKVGKPSDGKWALADRAYKELDVWKFAYATQHERQEAIDNAVRAYDRQRIGKEEKIWQMLLPKEKRDQGIFLSKLAIGASMTPNVGGSPLPAGDAAGEEKLASVATTPRIGAGTPKVGAGKNDLMKKLAKNPKQRAIEEAKEKKRKEREAAAAAAAGSDKEGKPVKKKQTTVKNNPKVKSAELVQSSSESEADDTKAISTNSGRSRPSASNASPNTTNSKAANASTKPNPMAKANTSASASASASSSETVRGKPTQTKATSATKPKLGTPSSKPSSAASSTKKTNSAPLGKNTPNGLHAPSSQNRSQLSPNKPHHRPTAPSPLGAARPRVASDVSDRGAIGIQRVKQGGEETPKGLGITNANGVRKRHDTVTSTDSSSSSKMNSDHDRQITARKATTNGTSTPKAGLTNGAAPKYENSLKRKQVDSPAREDRHAVKHRKIDSASSHSQNSQKSYGASSSNADNLERNLSSDSASSVRPQLSFNQGVREAQRFHEELYPRYTKLYDEQVAMERRGERVSREERQRLWAMHRRLELMKREIRDASLREQDA